MIQMQSAGTLELAHQGCFETPRAGEFLYDVASDPHCLVNLAGLPEYSDQMQVFRVQLKQWQERTGDRFPGEDGLTPDGFDRNTGKRLINARHPSFLK
jgi:hypothetical protein